MSDDKKLLKIYIFRHGETSFNKEKIFTGWLEPDLTENGIKQAEKVAESLKDKEFQVAFCSHLRRSIRTLEIVLKYHKGVKVYIDDRIIERNYGKLQGLRHADYIAEVGKKQFDIFHRSYDIPPPGGESIKMVEKRVNSFIDYLLDKMKREKINVAISAHGNSMRPFRRRFENLTIEEMMKLENPWDQYFEYDVPLD